MSHIANIAAAAGKLNCTAEDARAAIARAKGQP